ncbi:MAG: ABC transporter ATP-binding protein [Chitinophagaceae bacterium]|jgi:Cu-processing system ATP-binding protein|nr:ABC transporter ATP-binding protein [Chitinophagaceae bacterium]
MIEIENLNKKFGKLQALDNVSVQCNANECVALVGPNGSGKTTLIKCLLGMVLPDSGIMKFKGKSILKQWEYRSDIGYMPQIGRYPDNMTIGQVLDMLQDLGSGLREPDTDLIEAFELNKMLHKRMRTLSGGTRQKVSACIAFLFNPSVLILDEPTAGLDPIASEMVKQKLAKEKSKQKLILITSHVLSELDELATHVVYMQEGKLLFHKPVEKLTEETGEKKLNKAIAALMFGKL